MAILENVLIGPNQKEQVDPENEGLLYRIDEVYFKKFLMENVPWHWHPFLEFACVKEGDVEYSFAEKKVLLQKGDAIFINSNVFHATKPADREKRGKFNVVLFDHRFLCGGYHSNLERSYFLLFFVKHFSPKKASEFPVFTQGISLLSAGGIYAPLRMRACSIR